MSTFNELLDAIRAKSDLLFKENKDDREEIGALFMKAINQTMNEIKRREVSSDDFADLVVVHLIIFGAKAGYSAPEMKGFIHELKSEDPQDEEQ